MFNIIFRIGALGRLTVHTLSQTPPSPETASSPVSSTVTNYGQNTDVFVAGTPVNYQLPDGLTNSNFTGCMGSMYIDNNLVGLYNFKTNTMDSCTGCLEV